MSKLQKFYASETLVSVSDTSVSTLRSGFRTILSDSDGKVSLHKYLSGQLPYFYRKMESIVEDFESEHSALELMLDLMAAAPTTQSFRNSHGAEILAAHHIQEKLQYRRLYSKLTMTTSQDTNAHKMDALFVDTAIDPYRYIFVEAKSSILPTASTKTKTHRSGILKHMIASLSSYKAEEPRMELIRIRENLQSGFSEEERKQILSDLRAPGPELNYIGISVTNSVTVNEKDDDFILSVPCGVEFDYHAIVVTDLESLAKESYSIWDTVKDAIEAAK